MNSVHLKEGESVNANNWKTEFGSNEAAKEMVEHVGKQCSHFVTEEHYKKMQATSALNSSSNVPQGSSLELAFGEEIFTGRRGHETIAQ